jgi:putative endonuclease
MLGEDMTIPGDKRNWWVYLIGSEPQGTLYTGVTTDVHRRIGQHNGQGTQGAKATRGGRPWLLVHVEGPMTKVEAFRREHTIKGWPRDRKLALTRA